MSYWFLATPYTKYPDGIDAAYNMACQVLADLTHAGYYVYSPIVHFHPLYKKRAFPSGDYLYWRAHSEAMIQPSEGVLVCKMKEWQKSDGIKGEIRLCSEMSKQVKFFFPREIPVL